MKKTAVIYDKWLHQFGGAEMVACTMADALVKKGWDVVFIAGKYVHLHKIKDKFGIDLKDIPFYEIWNHENHLRKIVEGKDLFVNLSFMDYAYGYAKKNLYYTHFPTPIRDRVFNTALDFFHITGAHILLPAKYRDRIYNRIRAGIFFDMEKRLESYQTIFANSLFTQKWINKYWGMQSQVLYPPVPQLSSPESISGPKKNWICHLGRFFTLGHGKRQEVLIEAFKALYDSQKASPENKDLQLHLVGGVGEEPSSIQFVEELKKSAEGYPIFFHLNVSQTEISQVLSQSRLYWHATGYGENEEENPMAFEHFGIAPVEAIMSGCLPVLYDAAGLKEILQKLNLHDSLYTFHTIPQLVEHTRILLKQKAKILESTQDLFNASFSSTAFTKQFLALVNP